MLKAFIQVYNHHKLQLGESEGSLHLPFTNSPEYPAQKSGNDTNYDVALFKWGASTLLELSSEFNIVDKLIPEWQIIVKTLTPGPIDSDGSYMVNSNTPFSVPHRHFSHLFHIYPLHLTTYDGSDADRALVQRSLDKWTGLTCKGGACPHGFTFDGAASMSAMIPGREDAAAGNLTYFVLRSGKVHKSTMYSEGGSPCIESPLAAANSMQEMLLQSWGGIIRIFPSMPVTWPSAMFANLFAEGGIQVSARRERGTTQFAQFCNRGDMSGKLRVRVDSNLICRGATAPSLALDAAMELNFNITVAKGECVLCHQASATTFKIDSSELPGDSNDYNHFGSSH